MNWSVIYTQEDCLEICNQNSGGYCRNGGCADSHNALCCSGNRNQRNSDVCTIPVADAINVQYKYDDGYFCVKPNNGDGKRDELGVYVNREHMFTGSDILVHCQV